MNAKVPGGKYVLAVSGGVDSMVLLDLLAKQRDANIVVAHFNHGTRPEAAKDERLVASQAKYLSLPFEAGHGRLGKGASEEKARYARYTFLKEIKEKHKSDAIITAHHQDDLIETALINLLRGTGPRGLTAISSNTNILRPLLGYSKNEIVKYARASGLKWRDDPTNLETRYTRNYIRNAVLPGLTARQRAQIVLNIEKVAKIEKLTYPLIAKISQDIYKDQTIDRSKFAALPVDLGNELVVYWLRQKKLLDYDKGTVSRINMALRSYRQGTICPVKNSLGLEIGAETAHFSNSL